MSDTKPIPPEALDGRECLVWKTKTSEYPVIAEYDPPFKVWYVPQHEEERRGVYRAIPLSWCLAAPGMREVLRLFHDIQIKEGHHVCEAIPGGCPVKIMLAACEGKGEGS